MLSVFHTIDDEMVEPLQFLEFLLRDMIHIGAVCYISEAVSENGELVVHTADRDDFCRSNRIVFTGQ